MSAAGKEAAVLLGDEAVALGCLHAGISAAYGYPGTPSTEILEYLIAAFKGQADAGEPAPPARWCVNEKTALEAALGVSFAGRRSVVTMKHVGLNVASDPFINGALLGIKGGLVVAVADDPGMHSSQNEQDSRFYAAFAGLPCLEPRSQQEAYDMTREAFDISEEFHLPVLLRLTTRLSHARSAVIGAAPRRENPLAKAEDRQHWMLLPGFARENYRALLEKQERLLAWSTAHGANRLEAGGEDRSLVVLSSGLGGNYYEENLADLVKSRGSAPPWLHIGAYPLPAASIRELCRGAGRVLVIEEGQPFIEERLRGILPAALAISGRGDGALPATGELDPDKVRRALGLPPRPGVVLPDAAIGGEGLDPARIPGRPPQLCQGCPHGDSYETIRRATADLPSVAITADIGCYSLGAMPPYGVPETIVCMGASIGMAKGAAEAGIRHAVAVIGDSTFLHSGMTGLIDAVRADLPMTVVILDNSIVAMTGCQETMVPSEELPSLIRGLGVKAEHLVVLEAKKPLLEENTARLRAEIRYRGLSVVIFKRECLEAFRKRKSHNR
ncbi:MAG: indolepyruvate ferredoxin oxidoreductase subunit alpha [Spirochaetaceae bacterium]|jgi:indolepyruvate ferredoxin oxidoreductase alpha subunit|nr:indolepyruvate ferredoxin oxidoreductase subunit alpha [Spirochaetaceae bacterium]